MYVEGTGIGPYEGARIQVEPTGKVTVVTGVGTQGQGHYTTFAPVARWPYRAIASGCSASASEISAL